MHRFFTIEAFEDRRLFAFGNAPARVGYVDAQKHLKIVHRYLNPAAGGRVFHCIVQKIIDSFRRPAAVVKKVYSFRAGYVQFNLLLFQRNKNTVDGVSQGIGDRNLLFLQRDHAGLQTGGFHHGLNKEIQFIQLVDGGLEKIPLLIRRHIAGQQGVVDHLEICDGGPGLMGDVGHKRLQSGFFLGSLASGL